MSTKKVFSFALFASQVLATAAMAQPNTVSDELSKVYFGTCTPDFAYCAHFAPTEIPVHAIARYLKSAKSSIRIATYNMDVTEYVDILNEKLAQGVKVEFGVDYKLSFSTNKVWNSLKPQKNLVRYRLPVFRGSNPQMHNKIIVIDDKLVLFGSANFTYSGLVANYENILAVREPSVIAKFNAELDELKSNALDACRIFADDANACGQGTEKWDSRINELLTGGKLPESVVADSKQCKGLASGYGLLDERNLADADLDACITDAGFKMKLSAVAKAIAANEKYTDGSSTNSVAFKEKKHGSEAPVEVYFSPEDNVQRVILRELSKTLDNPKDSFALVSTNFITNKMIAQKLVELKRAGVRLEVFFDRGRADDPNFQQQMEVLKELELTIFNNSLTGPYGSNHNKMAVVGVGKDLVLLNGSANWSASAMTRNDENFVVVRDPSLAAIYVREILSQLFVYGFEQKPDAQGFRDLVRYLEHKVPCLNAVLSSGSCNVDGKEWKPRVTSNAVLSIEGVPADPEKEQVWVWVRQIEETHGVKALPLFTHEVFNGRWLTTVPVPPQWNIQFKFFKAPKGVDPNKQGIPNDGWEYGGKADRSLTVAPLGVHVVRDIYKWGQP